MILDHTKHIKDKRGEKGGKKRRERVEPTHIKSDLFISYGRRKRMQGRNPINQIPPQAAERQLRSLHRGPTSA